MEVLTVDDVHRLRAATVDGRTASIAFGGGRTPWSILEQLALDLPRVLDVVHLGLGADGHTASLVPGDQPSMSLTATTPSRSRISGTDA